MPQVVPQSLVAMPKAEDTRRRRAPLFINANDDRCPPIRRQPNRTRWKISESGRSNWRCRKVIKRTPGEDRNEIASNVTKRLPTSPMCSICALRQGQLQMRSRGNARTLSYCFWRDGGKLKKTYVRRADVEIVRSICQPQCRLGESSRYRLTRGEICNENSGKWSKMPSLKPLDTRSELEKTGRLMADAYWRTLKSEDRGRTRRLRWFKHHECVHSDSLAILASNLHGR